MVMEPNKAIVDYLIALENDANPPTTDVPQAKAGCPGKRSHSLEALTTAACSNSGPGRRIRTFGGATQSELGTRGVRVNQRHALIRARPGLPAWVRMEQAPAGPAYDHPTPVHTRITGRKGLIRARKDLTLHVAFSRVHS